jgi:hypothetical protein
MVTGLTSEEVLALAAARWERKGDDGIRIVVTVSEYRATGQSCDHCSIGVQVRLFDGEQREHWTIGDLGQSEGPGASWDAAWAQAEASGQGVVDVLVAEAQSKSRLADALRAAMAQEAAAHG